MYQLLTYCIKNQCIDVLLRSLHTIFWILGCITIGTFAAQVPIFQILISSYSATFYSEFGVIKLHKDAKVYSDLLFCLFLKILTLSYG